MSSFTHNSCRENIKVVCRLRPENAMEKNSGQKICITHNKSSLKINIDLSTEKRGSEHESHEFTFDHVFGSESRQVDLFNTVAKPMIEGALEGWNGTLFCYGQTSSGKTHTMEGKHDDMEQRGIIPRMMEYVFELINKASIDLEFTVKCSVLEIYNEKIQDLLDPRKNNLMVKEEKSKGIWVEDATEVYVMNKQEMRDVFKCGSENRKIGATAMNDKSSRSHSLFIVTIFQKDSKTDSTKTGKLYFVDLAGSEKLSKTKIEGGTLLEEAKNINKSLLMLGMVINALTEGRSHIPYRDSKLTRVLQESLGGNSHTTLIITCSMSSYNDKESLSTLRFGQRAKSIKNKLTVNTERSAKELLLKLQEAEEKIRYYQNLISQMQKGGGPYGSQSVSAEPNPPIVEKELNAMYSSNKSKSKCDDCSTAMRKLLNQHIEFVSMQEELEKLRQNKKEIEEEILARNREIYEMNEKVLFTELKTKLFIEEELKSFHQLQMKLENIFLCNQNKLLQTSKIKNILEVTRYEIFIMMKANKLKLEKTHHFALNEHLLLYEKNLEESLEILNKIEDFIITDNKSFNNLVDLITGKNADNDVKVSDYVPNVKGDNPLLNKTPIKNKNLEYSKNIFDYDNTRQKYSLKNKNNMINNINLNINKNININIFNNDKRAKIKRQNSFSYTKKKPSLLKRDMKDNRLYTKSCVPGHTNNQDQNYNTIPHSFNFYSVSNPPKKHLSFNSTNTVNVNIKNISEDSFIVHSDESFDLENQIQSTFNKNTNADDVNTILQKQRKTITDLAYEYKILKDVLSNKNKEFYEKEEILNKNSENILKNENQIREYEYTIEQLRNQIKEKDNQLETHKLMSMKEFEYKEKKIVDLINKINDLEDDNYKLVHFNKDKDKKKFYLMEKQIKEFTIEMQKVRI